MSRKPKIDRLNDLPIVKESDLFKNDKFGNPIETTVVEIKETEEKKEEKKLFFSEVKKEKNKYQVDKDSIITIKFKIVFFENTLLISENDADSGEEHWFSFREWNYWEKKNWMEECMDFNQIHRTFVLNTIKYTELKFRRLLKDWSLNGENNEQKLLHVNNQLCDESMELLFTKINYKITEYIANKMDIYLE